MQEGRFPHDNDAIKWDLFHFECVFFCTVISERWQAMEHGAFIVDCWEFGALLIVECFVPIADWLQY